MAVLLSMVTKCNGDPEHVFPLLLWKEPSLLVFGSLQYKNLFIFHRQKKLTIKESYSLNLLVQKNHKRQKKTFTVQVPQNLTILENWIFFSSCLQFVLSDPNPLMKIPIWMRRHGKLNDICQFWHYHFNLVSFRELCRVRSTTLLPVLPCPLCIVIPVSHLKV